MYSKTADRFRFALLALLTLACPPVLASASSDPGGESEIPTPTADSAGVGGNWSTASGLAWTGAD
ncbi:MAG TPA: hypothetical protein QF764_15365, partial [Planctomycetota bacterium]|nr:hypothetical protein [Planctomycetota bacterium]